MDMKRDEHSYVDNYHVVSEWLKVKPQIKVECDFGNDNFILLQLLLKHLNKFVRISQKLERDKIKLGFRGNLQLEERKVINEMIAD